MNKIISLIDNITELIDYKLKKLYENNPNQFKIVSLILFIVLLCFIFNIFRFDGIISGLLISLYIIFLIISIFFRIYIELLIYRNNKVKNNKKQIRKEEITQNKESFNILINNYSCAELVYLDNFSDDYKSLVIPILLKLINKNIIAIDNGTIVVLNNFPSSLKESEEYILKSIINGKVDKKISNNISDVVKNESVNDDLIVYKKNKVRSFILRSYILLEILCFLLIVLCFNGISINLSGTFTRPLIIFIINILVILYILHIEKNTIYRSENGIQINNYLNGLKHYLKENINSENDDIRSWENYIFYSVIFKMNNHVYNELDKVINN